MTESRKVFHALYALLTTQQNTDLVKESLRILESVISRSKEEPLEETPQSEDWEMCESEDRTHAMTISGKSPFYAFFQQIMKEVKEEMVDDDTGLAKEDNPYFCPGILTVLFDMYLAIFPLWSGLLLGDLMDECHKQHMETTKKQPKTRDANCHIERWFGIVKHSIMHKEKKVKPVTFIRKMHKSLQARYTEHIIKHELPQKLLRQPEAPLNLDQSQETWKKKEECFPSTKSKFFSVPHKIPAPQKMRIKKDVEVETSSSDACQPPADGLHVDEQIQMLLKKEHTELLVAIVRSPNQDLELDCENVNRGVLLCVWTKKEVPPKEEQCVKCERKEIRHKDDQSSNCGYRQRDPVDVLYD
ncbi:hypothetical protein DPX16_6083 [Anabarilius grahami]|uniref:Uncharacterized protein n=1 Tax=Anabarilius grahami TaxID=495550 RepID=A0A3N0Z0Y1_ANAGA|nr:hypothetical protein DPX16_6083 [Anabarilius grahami]